MGAALILQHDHHGSSWRRYDWRLSHATAWTDDHFSRAVGHYRTSSRRTVRPRDCGGAGLLGLDGAQMAPPRATPGAHRLQLPHGSPHQRAAQHSSNRNARCHFAPAPDASRLGPTTLLAELRVDPRWAAHPLPSRSRIAALLGSEKLTRRYQKHSDLPTPAIQPEGPPHDE